MVINKCLIVIPNLSVCEQNAFSEFSHNSPLVISRKCSVHVQTISANKTRASVLIPSYIPPSARTPSAVSKVYLKIATLQTRFACGLYGGFLSAGADNVVSMAVI